MKIAIKALLFGAAIAVPSMQAVAQDEYNEFLRDIDDGKVFIGAYVAPFMKSVSLGLNQGWYNTAKNHKLFGVDLTVTVSAMGIPEDETVINVPSLNMQNMQLKEGTEAPTIFGDDERPTFIYDNDGNGPNPAIEFRGLPGLNLKDKISTNRMPVPIANLGIGMPKNSELKIRFVPSVDLNGNGEFKMWGVGVLHDIKQHIPGIKLMPFDLAAFVGYTKLDMEYRSKPSVDINGENQRSVMEMSSTTIQALISKKFAVITFYGGIGYNIAKSNISLKGTYDLNDDGDTDDPNENEPLALDFAASGARATAGFRLKLAVLTLHADYSFQKYNAISAGIGISVR
jgi:hypothetical protein